MTLNAERPHNFADVDVPLFDARRVSHTTRDIRTVGELLFDADHIARQLLMNVTDDDAGSLLHGWPHVAAAAADLWSQLPGENDSPQALERDRPITRLASFAATVDRNLRERGWPPTTRPDRRLIEMAQTLRRASNLVERYGSEIPVQRNESNRDIQAARARIMHSLYVTAHAVGVSLNQYGRARVEATQESARLVRTSPIDMPYAVAPITIWVQRMSRAEATAGRYLNGRITPALGNETVHPVDDHTRIPRALARWDIHAHRALASRDWQASIVLITRTQSLIAAATLALIDATATAIPAARTPPPDRLQTAIADAGYRWTNLASRWGDLTNPHQHPGTDLVRAAAEMRAAYRELTHDGATIASPSTIATRAGLAPATEASLQAIEAGPDLADTIAQKASTTTLTGRARPLSIRAYNDIEAGLAAPHPDGDAVWISPGDIFARREVTLPKPVREALISAIGSTYDAATTAAALTLPASQDLLLLARDPQVPAFSRSCDLVGFPVSASSRMNHGAPTR